MRPLATHGESERHRSAQALARAPSSRPGEPLLSVKAQWPQVGVVATFSPHAIAQAASDALEGAVDAAGKAVAVGADVASGVGSAVVGAALIGLAAGALLGDRA